jgi:hypothetical protein
MALFACEKFFLQARKEQELEKITPRYSYSILHFRLIDHLYWKCMTWVYLSRRQQPQFFESLYLIHISQNICENF